MNNCYLTTLCGVVDNDTLPIMGGIKFHQVTTTGSNLEYHIVGVSRAIISNNTGNCHFTDSTGTENYGQDITGQSGYSNNKFYVTPGECDLTLVSKYDLDVFYTGDTQNSLVPLNTNDMRYYGANREVVPVMIVSNDFGYIIDYGKDVKVSYKSPFNVGTLNISDLVARFTEINSLGRVKEFTSRVRNYIGKLATLKSFTNLDRIALANVNFSEPSDIKELGTLTSLTYYELGVGAKVSGALEDFIVAQRTAGRASCTGIRMPFLSGVTWRGVAVSGTTTWCNISWTSNTMTFNKDDSTPDVINA